MPSKGSEESEKSAEQLELERRVDEMMSTKPLPAAPKIDKPPAKPPKPADKPLKIEIPDLKTAPKLPSTKQTEIPKEPKVEAPYKLKTPEKPPLVIKLEDDQQVEAETKPTDPPTPEATEATNSEPAETNTQLPEDPLADGATDRAVDEIVAKEGDTLLALDDAKAAKRNKQKPPSGWKDRLKTVLTSKVTWLIALVVLLILLAVPYTRYKITSVFIKKSVTIVIVDSKTNSPVSSAKVSLDKTTVVTDAYGKARLKAGVGPHSLSVSKNYYKTANTSYFVGFKAAPLPTNIRLVATGRLVPLIVTNKITGKPISGAYVWVSHTSAKTNSKGQAVIALPTTSDVASATITLVGYNNLKTNIQVTDKLVDQNRFGLTPAGKVYFLSNQSGNIDVIKSNLDGTERKTVLAGTGREDTTTTSLLASRDWRYLVLKAHREGANTALYLIDTTHGDKVTQFDSTDSEFSLVGWYGHNFIYDVTRKNVAYYQAGHEQIKSYSAENAQLNQIDQTSAEGDASNYAYQQFSNFFIVNGSLVYTVQWYSAGSKDLSGKNDSIRAAQPSGQNKKDYLTLASDTNDYIQAKLHAPQAVYYQTHNTGDGKTTYYEYAGQAVKTANIDSNTFAADYPTYLVSPLGNKTFWSELRDGKNALFLGDDEAQNKQQIAALSDYSPYGWYSDNYVLVAKNRSELFIMPAGSSSNRQPLKITDYYKPAQTYTGYGYGYGGL